MKITNQDIYNEIKEFRKTYEEQHSAIITRLDITNGKVKLSRWLASTALTVALLAIGYLFSHLL